MFAVVVTLTLKSGRKDDFMPLILTNAKTSLSQEAGCRQFDVATDAEHADEVFLYELYDDASAFAEHLASDHFKTFDAATAEMISEKSVRTYREVSQ